MTDTYQEILRRIDFYEEELKTETDWGRLAGLKHALDILYFMRDYRNEDYPVWAYGSTEEFEHGRRSKSTD